MASFDEVIPPGQVGHIDAQLDTHKLHGSVGRGLTVYTDDPQSPKVFLTVRATVVGGVVVLPRETISVRRLADHQVIPGVLIRRDVGETGRLEIGKVATSAPWLVATAERLTEAKPAEGGLPAGKPGDWLVTVRADPSTPYGQHRETLRIVTGLERQPEVTIPVLVLARAPVRLSADQVAFPPTAQQAGPERQTVLLTVRRDLDPSDLRVETDPELLRVELERSGQRGYKVHVSWLGDDRPHGAITFRVGQESYELPVVAPTDPS